VNPDQLLAPLKSLTKSLSTSQLTALGVAFVAVVGVIVGSAYWISAPTYALLASDLDAESASAITSKLKADKVPYILADGGRSIRVDSERADELRLEFASTGLPSAGRIGFEIFDRPAFGTTEFLEQINYRRALEGELARTIATLSEVSSARVHIAMAKDSLFTGRDEPAKASVVLRLKSNNTPLAPATAKGITGLVAASVESLRPESVVILDTNGRSLSRPQGTEGEEASSTTGIDRQNRIERDLATRVVALLEPVVGLGRVRVNVAARLKADIEEETEETWDQTPVIRSKQLTTETDARTNAQGTAGARANMPPNLTTSPTSAPATVVPSGSTRSAETTNYEIGKLTRHRTSPSGQLARLTVAVLLDEDRAPAAAAAAAPAAAAPADPAAAAAVDPAAPATPAPVAPASRTRSPEDIARIQQIVAAAVGFDETRGDLITVDSIAFDMPAEIDLPAAPEGFAGAWDEVKTFGREQGMSTVRIVAVVLIAAFAFFGVLRPMMRKALTVAPAPTPLPAAATGALTERTPTVRELEGRHDTDDIARPTPALARRVAKLATDEPEQVARIMRGWLAEEER